MTGNALPWIILLIAVAVALIAKGYVGLPKLARRVGPPQAGPGIVLPSAPMTSHELGMMFAQAKRREAEEELASLFAKKAGDDLKASFTAPFVSPEPAGPDQSGASQ